MLGKKRIYDSTIFSGRAAHSNLHRIKLDISKALTSKKLTFFFEQSQTLMDIPEKEKPCICSWEDCIFRNLQCILKEHRVTPLPTCTAMEHMNYEPRDVACYFCNGWISSKLRIYAHDVLITFVEDKGEIVLVAKREGHDKVIYKRWTRPKSAELREFMVKNIPRLVSHLYQSTSPRRVFVHYEKLM